MSISSDREYVRTPMRKIKPRVIGLNADIKNVASVSAAIFLFLSLFHSSVGRAGDC